MNKIKIFAAALAISVISSYSYAADTPLSTGQGKVNFTGKLIAETCKIKPGDENIDVVLPTLSTKTLNIAGIAAGSKSFDINVIDCPAGISEVGAHFEAIGYSSGDNSEKPGINAATGNLVNTATESPAKNVEVRLYNSNGNHLPLGNSGGKFSVVDGIAKLTYYGGYYATGVTEPGNVKATALYTLSYP